MKTFPRSRWFGPARPFHPLGRGLLVLLSALLLTLPVPALAAPGDLDPSFDGDGRVLTDFRDFEGVNALAVQLDGKLVAAGGFFPFFGLARYNADGSLDRSFGKGGRVRRNFGRGAQARALVLQPDGKPVAAGLAGSDFLLVRLNPDGSLDTSFGAGGVVRTDFGGGDGANALVLQPDGKLVAAGNRRSGTRVNVVSDLILARYHPDGSLDASFGAGGFVVESGILGSALVLQPDGKLVAAGGGDAPGSGDQLFRFNPDGTLDTSFGDGGRMGLNFGGPSDLSALVLQPDGKLVAAGAVDPFFSGDFLLARFNPDGSLDTSFGTGGFVVTDFGRGSRANALVLQADGKLVAGGQFVGGNFIRQLFIVARYHPDGSLDTSFGGGAVRTRFGGSLTGLQALALQADGKLVAAGDAFLLSRFSDVLRILDIDFALARYVTTDEPLAVPPKCGGRRATILGTSRNDTLRGTLGPDVILGRGGNDTIRGLGGNDTICGGPGRDTLIGNEGNDRLFGEGQNDRLFGDQGRDEVDGGSGRDACRDGETARRCEGQAAAGERPRDPPRPPCPPAAAFPCS
ncbi:MAG: hypothetical protein ACT4QB_05760 [Gammaproteobacteria bacterium]